MHLNKLQPRPNQTSSFLQEPFFSKIQRFENYDGFFIPVLSNELKTADFITIDKNNSNDFCLHETERVNSLLVENLSNKPLLILNAAPYIIKDFGLGLFIRLSNIELRSNVIVL